jgi:hypothetical protein|eukprot:1090202-Prymnesium_polylepis.1
MSDAVDARSAARERKTIVRQNNTFPQIPSTLACGTCDKGQCTCACQRDSSHAIDRTQLQSAVLSPRALRDSVSVIEVIGQAVVSEYVS